MFASFTVILITYCLLLVNVLVKCAHFTCLKYIACLHCHNNGCENWLLNDTGLHGVNVAWNNCFRSIFNNYWREWVKSLQYFCSPLPMSINLRKLTWKTSLVATTFFLPLLIWIDRYRFDATDMVLRWATLAQMKSRIWNKFVEQAVQTTDAVSWS